MRADDLRHALRAEAERLPAPDPAEARAGVRARVRHQRQRRLLVAAPLMALALIAGVAVARVAGDEGEPTETAGAPASDPTTTSTPPPPTAATVAPPNSGLACDGGELVDDPGTGGSICVPTTVAPGEPATTLHPDCTIPSMCDAVPDTTAVPETTVPDPAPTQPTTPTSVPTGDCGTHGASGWPTTMAPSPMILECLVGAFETGSSATAHAWTYDGPGADDFSTPPPGRIDWHWEVIGVRRLRVTEDRTRAHDEPRTVTVDECTSLDPADWFPPYTVGGCTRVSG